MLTQADLDAAVAAERKRCVSIVAKLWMPGHWSGGGVLHALEAITGSPVRVVEHGRDDSVLQWDT